MPIDKFHPDSYNAYEEDLLEYVTTVADRFSPDFCMDADGTAYECDSQVPFIFKRRYNTGRLDVDFTYDDYANGDHTNNERPIEIIKTLGIDPEKFWYLLLFVADYVSGSTVDTRQCLKTPKQEIEELVARVHANEKKVNPLYGATHKEPMSLTLRVAKHRLIISNPDTLSAIAEICRQALPHIDKQNRLNSYAVNPNCNKSASVKIWLFAEMFRYFFRQYPQFTNRRRAGASTTKSILILISKLAYFAGLTYNDDYNADDENLKGLLRQYRNYQLDTFNKYYG